MSENLDYVNPIRLTDNEGIINKPGDVYELDFSRESITFAEKRGFKVDDVLDFPVTLVPELFYLSFRKNHKNVAREKTDKFLKKVWDWKLPKTVCARLIKLYNQTLIANSIDLSDDEDEDIHEKNEMVAVEM